MEMIEKVNRLKLILLHRISEEGYEQPNLYADDYRQLRDELLSMPDGAEILPHFIDECLDLRMFWRFIRRKYRTYEKRQEYLDRAFARTLGLLESGEQ